MKEFKVYDKNGNLLSVVHDFTREAALFRVSGSAYVQDDVELAAIVDRRHDAGVADDDSAPSEKEDE